MYHVSAQGVDERMMNVYYYCLNQMKVDNHFQRIQVVRPEF